MLVCRKQKTQGGSYQTGEDKAKAAEVEFLLKLHKDKPMHGISYKHLEEHGLSQQLTFSFLRSSGLRSETEGVIMACQDGVFNTLVYRSRVMGVNVPDARCRARRQAPETLMHLLSACRTYAGTAYVHRHNAALRVLYYHLRHSYGLDETPVLPYAPGDIESVVENERCRIYWNYSFPTLELVNIVSKEEKKRIKYQELLGQLRRLWPDYAVSQLVMVIGSLGGMRNTLLSALRVIPVCRAAAHILAARMQKAVILGAWKYVSPSNLLTLYKAQIRPSLEYCLHIWGAAAPTTLSILAAVQRRVIQLIDVPALTCHLQPLSHRRAVGCPEPGMDCLVMQSRVSKLPIAAAVLWYLGFAFAVCLDIKKYIHRQ
nr:unnamed protein product [Callosobruchus chinensis]